MVQYSSVGIMDVIHAKTGHNSWFLDKGTLEQSVGVSVLLSPPFWSNKACVEAMIHSAHRIVISQSIYSGEKNHPPILLYVCTFFNFVYPIHSSVPRPASGNTYFAQFSLTNWPII